MAALAMPRNSRKPNTSVKVVTTTAEETAGSTPTRRRNSGTPAPTEPAMSMLPSIASPRDQPKAQVLLPENRDHRDQDAQPDPVKKAEEGLPSQEPPRPDADEIAEGDCPNDEGKGLGATNPALPRDDGQERGEHDRLSQGRLEEGNRGRGDERRGPDSP